MNGVSTLSHRATIEQLRMTIGYTDSIVLYILKRTDHRITVGSGPLHYLGLVLVRPSLTTSWSFRAILAGANIIEYEGL